MLGENDGLRRHFKQCQDLIQRVEEGLTDRKWLLEDVTVRGNTVGYTIYDTTKDLLAKEICVPLQ